MNFQINCTTDGLKKYPMHTHTHYEIMYYLEGVGNLHTSEKDYPFSPGTIIIVPPNIEHGSEAENGFKNISVGGDFSHLLHFKNTVVLKDNNEKEGKMLSHLIFNNRYKNNSYLSSLCNAYVHFLSQNISSETDISLAVNRIIYEITKSFNDYNINLKNILKNSGYAEDYIRAEFKKTTTKTPVEFLCDIRIKHACFLIDIYKNSYSLSEIAEKCGYTDYSYFCKRFKQIMCTSPSVYIKSL